MINQAVDVGTSLSRVLRCAKILLRHKGEHGTLLDEDRAQELSIDEALHITLITWRLQSLIRQQDKVVLLDGSEVEKLVDVLVLFRLIKLARNCVALLIRRIDVLAEGWVFVDTHRLEQSLIVLA